MMRIIYSCFLVLLGLCFPYLAMASDGGNCFDCHKKEAFAQKVVHQPVAQRKCYQCHNPHVAKHEGLLPMEVGKLCVSCHELLAGDHAVATDACGAWLMGHDPSTDWPTPPFKRDRNALLVAAQNGFGTVDLDEIDFQTDLEPPLAEFDPDEPDSKERVRSWRKTTCEQALFYRDHHEEIMDKYAGEYVFLQDGEVIWNGSNPRNLGSRRGLAGERPDSALWLKFVDPNDMEKEHFQVYERNLREL